MNEVKLRISGAAKTGKTTLLHYVAEKLEEAGCEVCIVPVNGEPTTARHRETLKTLKVEISEHQEARNDA